VVGGRARRLVLVLGDQLDPAASAFDGFDPERDAVWMAEVEEEATLVRCHKLRIALFFSAMRHFRDELRERGVTVHYTEMPARRSRDRGASLPAVLAKDVRTLRPEMLALTRPGDHRVLVSLAEAARRFDVPLEVREDRHFLSSPAQFSAWAKGRKQLVQESFYRTLRREHRILVGEDGEPEGGRWNFDEENRESFGRAGPGAVPEPPRFAPDAVTREVLALVEDRFADHPGSVGAFGLPVTRHEARACLRDFVRRRLPAFGRHEDAMWRGEPFLFHSRLSAVLNLKLLDPRECVAAAVAAYEAGHAPLASVEGFVRQIVGWREFVRGIYWHFMPAYVEKNALGCEDRDVPPFFWDGRTQMRCVQDGMQSVLEHGYAHHIVRLMVLGLFAQLLGVHPRRFHDWHMALYLDAIDWVSLPNTLGMSQYGDGGIMATKPYCASGAYVNRMSNHCGGCPYDPKQAVGEKACPLTTLYWDFLARHRRLLAGTRRMAMQMKNLERKPAPDLAAIRRQAKALRARIDAGGSI
jgi:deoxyribodipyrimidine photolyase-related protein